MKKTRHRKLKRQKGRTRSKRGGTYQMYKDLLESLIDNPKHLDPDADPALVEEVTTHLTGQLPQHLPPRVREGLTQRYLNKQISKLKDAWGEAYDATLKEGETKATKKKWAAQADRLNQKLLIYNSLLKAYEKPEPSTSMHPPYSATASRNLQGLIGMRERVQAQAARVEAAQATMGDVGELRAAKAAAQPLLAAAERARARGDAEEARDKARAVATILADAKAELKARAAARATQTPAPPPRRAQPSPSLVLMEKAKAAAAREAAADSLIMPGGKQKRTRKQKNKGKSKYYLKHTKKSRKLNKTKAKTSKRKRRRNKRRTRR